ASVSDQDTTELYKARATRDEMADFILQDLKDAEQKINPDGNGPNTINTNVVRALISRFGLVEGTWRKYHGIGGEAKFFEASKVASTALMSEFPSLNSDYDAVFNSESLDGVNGIILYKAYEFAILTGNYAHYNRSSIGSEDITKKGADMFLCTDGQTIHTSPLFDGEQDPYDEFRNRDRRMYVNITPPFRVDTDGKNQLTWKFVEEEKHREYIDLMVTLYPNETQKRLPDMNWRGLILKTSPHFRKFSEGQGFNVTYSGYSFHKYYNTIAMLQNQDSHDTPLFRMGEVLLNHAEVMKELNQFDQAVADATINKLRERGDVEPLVLNSIPDDPTRDSDVDAVMWEIRRERFVEYFGEGFGRALDIKRWKKLVEYGADEKVGRWIVGSDYDNIVPISGGDTEGYVKVFGVPPGVPEYYYLEPLPSNEIVLNPKIIQNPGWND
ncbi:MAG: RagB/SusD family nutrient uptake outer membrane protein, partial [Draconibacterium sp.]|nr:RagB/SusD family nutrient uptake outer membrane protein [Draconibacterium sp.]